MVADSVELEKTLDINKYLLSKYTVLKLLDETLELHFLDNSPPLDYKNGQEKCPDLKYPFARSPLTRINVKDSKILLQADGQLYNKNIMELKFDIKNLPDFTWQPGNTIAILPHNDESDVEDFLEVLNLHDKADNLCAFELVKDSKKAKYPLHIPKQTTPREILRDCLNLRGILKKQFLRALAEYCSNTSDACFLKSISSKEGSEYYNEIVLQNGFTLLNILKICGSCQPPLNLLVEHLPRLLPREYSIASSPLINSEEFNIIFSIFSINPGITTKMLQNKPPQVLMYLRQPNTFCYTEDDFQNDQILIAVGGAALAPYLGFLQHKQCLIEQGTSGIAGKSWLFVGAVSQEAIVHRAQLMQWLSTNVLNKFIESHSRSGVSSYQYIHEALIANSKVFIEQLLQSQTSIYICADGSQISKAIEITICKCLSKEINIELCEAQKIIEDYRKRNKYREDLWS
uniref:Methionine synthase reductase n=1 Tax=Glossina brevipalpis TaxID=37001 RepID=A0A1A9WFP3_9MUSC